jgi:hypothetical protein
MPHRAIRSAVSAGAVALGYLTGAFLLFGADVTDRRGLVPRNDCHHDSHDDTVFGPWSAPVNVGAPVNSADSDFGPNLSRDGLSLYFSSNRPGGWGGNDIWVAQRAKRKDPWGEPRNLGAPVNTPGLDQGPTLSRDGRSLYFFNDRPGGFGAIDLYVSHRRDRHDDFGWEEPQNLGPMINSAAVEAGAALFEHGDTLTLYFQSNRPNGIGGYDIYVSERHRGGDFEAPLLVEELSTPFDDRVPAIRGDGLEIFLDSDRPGTLGGFDIWSPVRATTCDRWSPPTNLTILNTPGFDGRPAPTFDGRSLYFFSNRPGGFGGNDLYISTRERLEDDDDEDEHDQDDE